VVEVFLDDGRGWLDDVSDDPCAQVLEAEPAPVVTLEAVSLDDALGAVGDFADLKSPWFRGRSAGVAALAAAAAELSGLAGEQVDGVRRAAMVHDVGRVGIASGIWDHRGPLTAEHWERIRLHPYLSERVLQRCTLLAPYAATAGRHHERADASGYHRGLSGDQLTTGEQVLAVADSFHAMTEARPHRPALPPNGAAAALRDEVSAGRFAPGPVEAVLAAAGEATTPFRVARPANLTEREVDVLRLLARGRSNRAIGAELRISPKTVGHHVQHIYAKAGVNTRAGAALFAMESGLLAPPGH
jgi:HD-GYP domain-containing protein (c-di-GMP phosphodiesterase class II)